MPAAKVIQRLCDTVSKNGNLLLSIPMRGDGTIDSEEEKILAGITRWMRRNGDAAIFGSRPWRTYGEGPTKVGGGMFGEGKVAFTAEDVRFTTRKGTLYAALMVWPEQPVTIVALGKAALPGAAIERVSLVGGGRVKFQRGEAGLTVTLPRGGPDDFVPVLRIDGRGLV